MWSHQLSSDSMSRLNRVTQKFQLSSGFPEQAPSPKAEDKEPEQVDTPVCRPWPLGLLLARHKDQCLGHLILKGHLLGLLQADCSVVKARMGNLSEAWFRKRDFWGHLRSEVEKEEIPKTYCYSQLFSFSICDPNVTNIIP